MHIKNNIVWDDYIWSVRDDWTTHIFIGYFTFSKVLASWILDSRECTGNLIEFVTIKNAVHLSIYLSIHPFTYIFFERRKKNEFHFKHIEYICKRNHPWLRMEDGEWKKFLIRWISIILYVYYTPLFSKG